MITWEGGGQTGVSGDQESQPKWHPSQGILAVKRIPPPKTNMEPENDALEEEISIKKPSFSGSMFVFGGIPQKNSLPPTIMEAKNGFPPIVVSSSFGVVFHFHDCGRIFPHHQDL